MLFNPNWNNTHPLVSLEGLIAWLETKNPTDTYRFCACDGSCLFSQYLTARGVPPGVGTARKSPEGNREGWIDLHDQFGSVANGGLRTFGDALARAKRHKNQALDK